MHARILFRSAGLTLALLAILVPGCSSPLDPTTGPTLATRDIDGADEVVLATGSSKNGFYPLAAGNHWVYLREETIQLNTPGETRPEPSRFTTTSDRSIVCIENRDGLEYPVEQIVETTFFEPVTMWRRYRQDGSGLYELDLVGEPPLCAPVRQAAATGTSDARSVWDLVVARSAAERNAVERLRERVEAVQALTRSGSGAMFGLPVPQARTGESTRLRYPLQIKERWNIRDDPNYPLTARVEALEALNLPSGRQMGYRIRLQAPFYGPDDSVQMWYGRAGYLQTIAHLELSLRDVEGNIFLSATFDQRETLTGVQLAGPPVPGFPPPLGGPAK